MTPISELLAYLDELLEPTRFADYAPNGLQVPGPATVSTVVTGVSASAELFTRAAGEGADLVLVHHGLIWRGEPEPLDHQAAARLRLLFDHDMALAAYHLPLDAHLEVGNNALIASALGAATWRGFGEHRGETIGVLATLPGDGLDPATLAARLRDVCHGREPLLIEGGPDRIRTVAIVSGAGADHLGEAVAAGADAFITGEPREWVMTFAREHGITFLAAGHYATETHGVRALGDRLARTFGIRHVFVDVWNPI